ncbi:rubrerythrin family protein [[Eubacterium] cellulosolvens]
MGTDENLQAAFSGESQANRKYTAFSRKAEQEGFPNVAKLFKAAAEAETVHALSHLRTMKQVGSTNENLKIALEGEVYEHAKMYPEFIKEAESENRNSAKITFNYANQVEKVHANLYQHAIDAVNMGRDIEKTQYFVCQTCGYTAEGEAPDTCPVCGSPKQRFTLVE